MDNYELFFTGRRLIKLFKNGMLDKIINKFSKSINSNNFLGCGGDAAGFIYYYDKTQVLKICTKNLKYFKFFMEHKYNLSADIVMKYVKPVHSLLPINKILYEDENLFVYLQDHCDTKLTINDLRLKHLHTLTKMLIDLVEHNLMVKTALHNLGFDRNNKLIIFDYHGMIYLNWEHNKLSYPKFNKRVLKNILKYSVFLYDYGDIKTSNIEFDSKFVKKISNNKKLCKPLRTIIKYLCNNKKIEKTVLLRMLNDYSNTL